MLKGLSLKATLNWFSTHDKIYAPKEIINLVETVGVLSNLFKNTRTDYCERSSYTDIDAIAKCTHL